MKEATSSGTAECISSRPDASQYSRDSGIGGESMTMELQAYEPVKVPHFMVNITPSVRLTVGYQ